jgi:hypothetical protein
MRTDILTTAFNLPDHELLQKIEGFATAERETTAELVAHLAALEQRPSLFAARGYGSLFAYCTEALHLSEDAACNRIDAARACRRFPQVLDLLAAGLLTLTSIRLLKRHLTDRNIEAVLRRAVNRTKEEIEALVAELDPKPDVAASVRKLPQPKVIEESTGSTLCPSMGVAATPDQPLPAALPIGAVSPLGVDGAATSEIAIESLVPAADSFEALVETVTPSRRPGLNRSPSARPQDRGSVKPLSPERYRVQFTVGQEEYETLKRLQALLRREIPTGDPGVVFTRGLAVLLEKVEREKLGATRGTRRLPTADRARGNDATRIRPGTDKGPRERSTKASAPSGPAKHSCGGQSRHIPNQVRRTVWWRDRGQCAFVSQDGRRCTERSFLELHHIHPYALDGPATAGNIALRCRIHNAYEAEVVFGVRPVAKASGP